jgi:hypothetical protein
MNKIPLEPLFRKLWITEASTPEEIRKIAQSLRDWDIEDEDMTDWFKTEPLSDEINAAAERFNRWEFDDDESKKSD